MSGEQLALRNHVLYLVNGGGAHLGFEEAFGDVPPHLRSAGPPGLPYTPWRLLEHLRIAQRDILDFCRNREYRDLLFPEGYWPQGDGPVEPDGWDRSMEAFRSDLQEVAALVRDPAIDLFARIPWGDGQTYLREALLVADHNAYHLGQMVVLRTLLGLP